MRVAISTGGGDAPGLNAVIRAATLCARRRGWEVVGIRDGFNGLMFPDQYHDGDGTFVFERGMVRGIGFLGGTVLGSTNRGNPCHFPVQQADGTVVYEDRTEQLVTLFRDAGIDALITIGGDGSLAIGQRLYEAGLRVIGVPKTIDNDLDKTSVSFGFDTAVEVATESIDRVFTTATSHSRVFVVEVMGRYAGWIALNAGVAAGAHAILIPEIPFSLEPVAAMIKAREQRGANFAIVVVAEGALPRNGHRSIVEQSVDQAERLGGVGHAVARQLTGLTGKEARTVVLGHLLRGGTPTAHDRLLGTRFGAAAVRALEEGFAGVMVALNEPRVDYVPLIDAIGSMRTVPLDCDTVVAGRDIGICFGDDG
ncbi:MAG TPA: ATP-dependent 6-phosphofructokinase [Ilumatobacteraceae bacterium]|jgi:6-phosphofructokinase 1|nr:ATP-dependent 6-phosphofructokinase [Ilumatobacteraceae bacterium]